MAVTIAYDADGRMLLTGLSCDCPCRHDMPAQDLYVGEGLLKKAPAFIRRRGLGTRCLLVCDANTYAVAGREVEEALRKDGFSVILCRIERLPQVEPDETSVGEALLSLSPDTECCLMRSGGWRKRWRGRAADSRPYAGKRLRNRRRGGFHIRPRRAERSRPFPTVYCSIHLTKTQNVGSSLDSTEVC